VLAARVLRGQFIRAAEVKRVVPFVEIEEVQQRPDLGPSLFARKLDTPRQHQQLPSFRQL